MKYHSRGFGGLQFIIAVAVIGAVTALAAPKYKSFVARAKITEAFTHAGESKRKLAQYYMMNNRFPGTAGEAEAMKTVTLSPPEFVQGMVIEPNAENHAIIVKVFLKPDVVENDSGAEQYIYVAGNKAANGDYAVEWSCGASGVGADLLPKNCKS